MTKIIGKNINITDTAVVSDGVEITVNTAVTAVASNDDRLGLEISITVQDAWVRKMPAATDASTRKGTIIMAGGPPFRIPAGGGETLYTGEVSIINVKNGKKPVFTTTEY